jgi:hypothetical protein
MRASGLKKARRGIRQQTTGRQIKMQVGEVSVVKYKKVLSSPSTGPSPSGHKDRDGHVGWQ